MLKIVYSPVMSIDENISKLLFEHDCVIVPDFGGFVCNYSPASVHTTKHRFRPPYKKISFNLNLKNNDGLLANQIAQTREISYSDSLRLIARYVEDLKKDLSLNKRFDFGNIGTIYLGEENNLLFEQDETVNYLPESFGLSTFNSLLVKRESIERKVEGSFKDKVIIPSQDKKEITIVKQKISPYILASAAVLVIGFLVWIPIQSGLIKNTEYSNLNPFARKEQPLYQPSEINLPEPDVDVDNESVSSKLLATVSDTTRYLNIVIDGKFPIVVRLKEDATTVAKTKKKDTLTKYRFHIVGGAFVVSENAEKFYTKLIKDGHQASIIEKNNLHFVSYGEFATKKEAMQALDRIRAVQKDAWLMTN